MATATVDGSVSAKHSTKELALAARLMPAELRRRGGTWPGWVDALRDMLPSLPGVVVHIISEFCRRTADQLKTARDQVYQTIRNEFGLTQLVTTDEVDPYLTECRVRSAELIYDLLRDYIAAERHREITRLADELERQQREDEERIRRQSLERKALVMAALSFGRTAQTESGDGIAMGVGVKGVPAEDERWLVAVAAARSELGLLRPLTEGIPVDMSSASSSRASPSALSNSPTSLAPADCRAPSVSLIELKLSAAFKTDWRPSALRVLIENASFVTINPESPTGFTWNYHLANGNPADQTTVYAQLCPLRPERFAVSIDLIGRRLLELLPGATAWGLNQRKTEELRVKLQQTFGFKFVHDSDFWVPGRDNALAAVDWACVLYQSWFADWERVPDSERKVLSEVLAPKKYGLVLRNQTILDVDRESLNRQRLHALDATKTNGASQATPVSKSNTSNGAPSIQDKKNVSVDGPRRRRRFRPRVLKLVKAHSKKTRDTKGVSASAQAQIPDPSPVFSPSGALWVSPGTTLGMILDVLRADHQAMETATAESEEYFDIIRTLMRNISDDVGRFGSRILFSPQQLDWYRRFAFHGPAIIETLQSLQKYGSQLGELLQFSPPDLHIIRSTDSSDVKQAPCAIELNRQPPHIELFLQPLATSTYFLPIYLFRI
jgi:hypothetical protein